MSSGTRCARGPMAVGLAVAVLLSAACSGDGDAADDTAGSSTSTTTAPTTTGSTEPMTDVELATQAYVAGYPLVVTMRTLRTLSGLLGTNSLLWQRELSGPQSRLIVAPNRDTLYSVAVLDLRAEPMVLTLPEIVDRYFTYQLLDAWTESFDYIGTRTTAGRAGTWAITAPGWEGEVPAGTTRIEAPTPVMFLLGRYLVDDEADIASVLAISEDASLRPWHEVAGTPDPADPPPLGEPAGTPQQVPADASFWPELADALAIAPPTTPVQRDLFEQAAGIGIGPDSSGGDPEVLEQGAAAGDAEIDDALAGRGGGTSGGGWSVNLDVGAYGDDLLQRAVVSRVGWGANVPEEAVYPVARTDAAGEALDGGSTYRITFPPGGEPPVDAFWSLCAYGPDLFFVEHPSGRYSIGDRTPGLAHAADGSLTLTLAHEDPGPGTADEPVNWLPVPADGFVLMMRQYLPGAAVLDGSYQLPPIEAVPDS